MTASDIFVGIDISKSHLDVAVTAPGDQTFTCPNNEGGIQQLVRRLQKFNPKIILLEATGGYEFPPSSPRCSGAGVASLFHQPQTGAQLRPGRRYCRQDRPPGR